MTLTNRIKQFAYDLGFALCGVTTPAPPPHLAEYEAWIEQGLHGEMGYMGSERGREGRTDPCVVFPECRSILVLAANYYQGDWPKSRHDAPTGRVARYAWGQDYHDVLLERLRTLISLIEEDVGHTVLHKLYTDTGPLLERELAQRAGLGWIGKNTMLISPEVGSWTLLAEAMLDLELDPDESFAADHCGSCTRCVEACPTDAILTNPRRLDSNRCISYLTIELKGEIEPEKRMDLGNWVFGCDICQDVCPWNLSFAKEQSDPSFDPRQNFPNPDLQDLLSLSEEEFDNWFSGSPVRRTRRRGLLRNAAVALGNIKDPRSAEVLSQSGSDDTEEQVRVHAAWALSQLSSADQGNVSELGV